MIAAGTAGECREGTISAVAAADDEFTTTNEGMKERGNRYSIIAKVIEGRLVFMIKDKGVVTR